MGEVRLLNVGLGDSGRLAGSRLMIRIAVLMAEKRQAALVATTIPPNYLRLDRVALTAQQSVHVCHKKRSPLFELNLNLALSNFG